MIFKVWSLGITVLELADGKPTYAEIHPMRAIFMIPTKPAPTLREPLRFSEAFADFLAKCLVKNPTQRSSSSDLLHHSFVKNVKPSTILCSIINKAIMERNRLQTTPDDG